MDEKNLKKLLTEQTVELKEEYLRQGKFLLEEFEKRTSIIAEMHVETNKKIDQHGVILNQHGTILNQHGRKLDAILEMVAKNTEDIEIIKGMLKRKVDLEEFESLERRVNLIEKKLRPV